MLASLAQAMEFRILGPLEVVAGGTALEVGGPKQRAVLALLLLEANRVVSADRLIEAIWEETPPDSALKALQLYVSQLRKVLGRERVETRAPGYLLRVEPDELDLTRFERLREGGSPHEALALWRGAPLAEFAYSRFAAAEIERLDELRLACLEERVERDMREGRHAELVGELESLVEAHPLRERPRGQLMLALYRSGRQAEALAAYRDARAVLVESLGIEPSRALRELEKAILAQDPALDAAAARVDAVTTAPQRPPFVGREVELAELVAALDAALAGSGSLWLLAGEPGIGKSRLAEELVRHARERGALALVGRCWEAGGAPAYWPWVQSLRAYVRQARPDALRAQLGTGAVELAQVVPELREVLPELAEPVPVEPEGARFRLFDATAHFLRSAAADRPLLLVLDDLHAADAPSLLLLQFLAREIGSTRMLVLGAFRDVDPLVSGPLAETLAELVREPATGRISLAGLDERDVAAFVDQAGIATPGVAETLHEETEGNPLFLGELVRLLAVEGVGADLRHTIPDTLRDVIGRRLAHLTPECNRVLVLASVFGREFAVDLLERVSELREDELLNLLDEALGARVLTDVPDAAARLRFAHVLFRDALYDGLTTPRRVRLHRLVLDALEAMVGEAPGPYLAELAHHAIAASEFERGLRYARTAGDRALALLAYEEAARLYEEALDTLDAARPGDDAERCELLLSLGEAETRAGSTPAAKAAFLAASGVARSLARPRELARAAAGYGGRHMWGRAWHDPQLVPLLEEALDALGDADVELRARLLARLAGGLRDEHDRGRRDRLSREALEAARSTGNPVAIAYALDGRVAAILAPDTTEECLALGMEFRRLAEHLGDVERVAMAIDHCRNVQVVLGEMAAASAGLTTESGIAVELGQPELLWQVAAARAMYALAAGRLAEGEAFAEEALALGEETLPQTAIPVHRLQRYVLCDFRGRVDEALPGLAELVEEYPNRPLCRAALAHAHVRLGRFADAQATLDELTAPGEPGLPFEQEWLYGTSLLAEAAALAGDARAAGTLYGLLLPWEGLNAADHPEGFRGSVARDLGVLARLVRPGSAAAHFETALAMNERTGAAPWLARTRHDYGLLLLEGDDPGRGRALVGAALDAYRELGMTAYTETAAGLDRV